MSGQSSLSKVLSRALDANLRYTALAAKLATGALDSAFSAAAEIGPQFTAIRQAAVRGPGQHQAETPATPQPPPAAIVLEGALGSTAAGFFVVENSLPHEISTPVEVSPLVAPDGREIQSALRFEPGVMTLAAGQQVVARVSAKITRRLVAGERYEGEIRVPGVAGARVPIVLRRKPDAEGKASSRKKAAPALAAVRKKKPRSTKLSSRRVRSK